MLSKALKRKSKNVCLAKRADGWCKSCKPISEGRP